MKKNIFYFLLAAVLFAGCTKNDGPVSKDIALERIPQPQIVKNGGSAAIDVTNLASFKGVFNVGVYFATDVPPAKFDVVIMKNSNKGNVKLFKADVTAFPTTLDITAAQLAALFGAPVVLNDNYDIGVDIYTQSGKKYEAFPATGVGFGSGIAAEPGASTSTRYSAICQYDPNVYQGNFVVSDPDWQDFSPGDVVVLTKIDATHFSWIDPFVRNPVPVVVTVNPLNNSVSIAKQTIGTSWTYSSNPATYPNPFVQTAAGTNVVAPCDKTVTFAMQYGFGTSTFSGTYPLVFTKQ